ncbi:MAG TPA: hypothetical protein VF244_02785 [Acidimicrobiales bacterium]
MSLPQAFEAVRRHRGKTITVVVHLAGQPDGVLGVLGGQRAARAQAAIVTCWTEKEGPGVYGLRANLHDAQVEAHRLATRTHFKHGRTLYPTNRPEWAVAVPVTEEWSA